MTQACACILRFHLEAAPGVCPTRAIQYRAAAFQVESSGGVLGCGMTQWKACFARIRLQVYPWYPTLPFTRHRHLQFEVLDCACSGPEKGSCVKLVSCTLAILVIVEGVLGVCCL